jgi:hypothetical protein
MECGLLLGGCPGTVRTSSYQLFQRYNTFLGLLSVSEREQKLVVGRCTLNCRIEVPSRARGQLGLPEGGGAAIRSSRLRCQYPVFLNSKYSLRKCLLGRFSPRLREPHAASCSHMYSNDIQLICIRRLIGRQHRSRCVCAQKPKGNVAASSRCERLTGFAAHEEAKWRFTSRFRGAPLCASLMS